MAVFTLDSVDPPEGKLESIWSDSPRPFGSVSATGDRSGSENERVKVGGALVAILATGFGCSESHSDPDSAHGELGFSDSDSLDDWRIASSICRGRGC